MTGAEKTYRADERASEPDIDVVEDLLAGLRFRGSLYFSAGFNSPWSVRVPSHRRTARVHLVINGQCWIAEDVNSNFIRLNAGDCAIVTDGREHFLRDSPERAATAVHGLPATDHEHHETADLNSTGRTDVELFCGHVLFDALATHSLAAALPPILVIRREQAAISAQFHTLVASIRCKSASGEIGFKLILARLAEILFIEAIAIWLSSTNSRTGLLAALNDPHVGRALRALHARPDQHWTVKRLAQEAGQSRSGFAMHFGQLMGVGPMAYLGSWRLGVACKMLTETEFSIERIARSTGYASTSSFTRAFKKSIGTSPGQYRSQT
jgi:AraC-like DNA-binding protein